MMVKPKKCTETTDEAVVNNKKEINKEQGLKRYGFPKHGVSVMAKSLDEAEKKVKAIVEYKNKSI